MKKTLYYAIALALSQQALGAGLPTPADQDLLDTVVVVGQRRPEPIEQVVGADIVTAGLAVYQAAFEHPFTRKGLAIFQDAWDKTAPE